MLGAWVRADGYGCDPMLIAVCAHVIHLSMFLITLLRSVLCCYCMRGWHWCNAESVYLCQVVAQIARSSFRVHSISLVHLVGSHFFISHCTVMG